MKKTVYLFSGQGSQYSGMGKEICEMNPASLQIYECASDILGFDLAKICFDGEEAELAKTGVAQPAIMATSLAVLELMEKRKKAWETAKAFLDSRRGSDGLISAEDNATYERMEADVVALDCRDRLPLMRNWQRLLPNQSRISRA